MMKNKDLILAWDSLSMPKESKHRIRNRLAHSLESFRPEPALPAEAQAERVSLQKMPSRGRGWGKYLSVAALVLLVLGLSLPLYRLWKNSAGPNLPQQQAQVIPAPRSETTAESAVEPDWQPASDLEPVTLSYPRGFHSLGAGELSGLLYHDISENEQFNVLDLGGAPSHLPVFENPYYANRDNHPYQNKGASEAELQAIVEDIARQYNISLAEFYFFPPSKQAARSGYPLNEEGTDYIKTAVLARGDLFDIYLKVGVSYTLYFKEPFALPENSYLHVTTSSAYDPYTGEGEPYEVQKEKIKVALDAVLEQYAYLLPEHYIVTEGTNDYSYYGERLASTPYLIVPEGETLSEQIVAANFNTIHFSSGIEITLGDFYGYDSNTPLPTDSCYGITFSYADRSLVLGDYPVISPEKAEELLKADQALPQHTPTSTLQEKLEQGELVRVDLRYRCFEGAPYFIPYYVFTLEEDLPASPNPDVDPALKCYQPLYVPAIDPDYFILVEEE